MSAAEKRRKKSDGKSENGATTTARATQPNDSYINLKRSTVFNGAVADIRRRDMCCLHDINTNSCVPVRGNRAQRQMQMQTQPICMAMIHEQAVSDADSWQLIRNGIDRTHTHIHTCTRTHAFICGQDWVAAARSFRAVDALISWDTRSVRRKIKWL